MHAFQREDGLLFVESPQVDGIVRGASHEELLIDHVDCVDGMTGVVVQKLLVLVDLPEDYLSIQAARDNSILRVGVDGHNVSSVTVVRIHIVHISEVPDFQRSILRDSVKLIIFSIHGNASNSVSVPKELGDLLLVVDVPDTYYSILASGDHQLTVGRDG